MSSDSRELIDSLDYYKIGKAPYDIGYIKINKALRSKNITNIDPDIYKHIQNIDNAMTTGSIDTNWYYRGLHTLINIEKIENVDTYIINELGFTSISPNPLVAKKFIDHHSSRCLLKFIIPPTVKRYIYNNWWEEETLLQRNLQFLILKNGTEEFEGIKVYTAIIMPMTMTNHQTISPNICVLISLFICCIIYVIYRLSYKHIFFEK
jgi:hypothetical protein